MDREFFVYGTKVSNGRRHYHEDDSGKPKRFTEREAKRLVNERNQAADELMSHCPVEDVGDYVWRLESVEPSLEPDFF